MARPYYSVKHVRTLAELPQKLTRGRAYFVDDEAYIIIDHGMGPVIYGNKSGPQGQPGEPIPILQAQIDELTRASFGNTFNLYEFNNARKQDIQFEMDQREVNMTDIYTQLNFVSNAVLTLTKITSDIAENLRGTENAMLKLLLDNEQVSTVTPLKQYDVLTTDGYSWSISEAAVSDEEGTLIFTLKP